MATAYCKKCEKITEIKNPKEVIIDRHKGIQGVCSKCNTKVIRFTVFNEEIDRLLKETQKANPKPGSGQGVGKPRRGEGGRDLCVCPKCKQTYQHVRGTPCNKQVCPKCKTPLAPYSKEE